jgi:hypothetical protein
MIPVHITHFGIFAFFENDLLQRVASNLTTTVLKRHPPLFISTTCTAPIMSSTARSSNEKASGAASALSPQASGEFDVPKPQTPSKLLKSPIRRSPSRSPLVAPSPMRVAKRSREENANGNISELRLDAATALSLSALPDPSSDSHVIKRPFRPSLAAPEYTYVSPR